LTLSGVPGTKITKTSSLITDIIICIIISSLPLSSFYQPQSSYPVHHTILYSLLSP
jgi:hypothetical protein